MTRTLLVAYHFPPIGGAGSQRSLKLARYLPEVSERSTVTVVTGPGRSVDRWSPLDESLAAELGGERAVYRVEGPEPDDDSPWRARAERWLLIGTDWSRWWLAGATEAGVRAGGDADVIVASMPPYLSADAAGALSRRLGRPWVADLRDPWALDEMLLYPSALHRRLDIERMRRRLRTAAAIVTTTPEAAARIVARFPELRSRPVVTIPNGFDAGDFAEPPPAREGDAFRIVHTGYLHTSLGLEQRRRVLRRLLGGGVPGTNLLTRSHLYLMRAIELVLDRRVGPGAPIELHLAGALTENDRAAAEWSPFVRAHGYLHHRDAVRLMRSADLLFLPMQKMPPGTRSGIVPGKTYEYLASGRPILAAVPEGDARDILLEAGTARICEPDDVVGMAAAIEAELDGRDRGEEPPAPAPAVLERFERRALAARYADLLGAVAANGTARPGSRRVVAV